MFQGQYLWWLKPSSNCHHFIIKKNNDDGTAFELFKNDAVMTN
tara:strand:- start:664 stop:792 length:129 start_codon:yes stop_codon:yes gene_type:complete